MVRELTHFIGGKHAPGTSGLFSDVYDPNTGLVQARVPLAGRADTERAIADAESAQQEWGEWNPQRRARVLLKFLQLVDGERSRWPGCSPPSTARPSPTRTVTFSAAWRSSSSPPGSPICSRGNSPTTRAAV